MIKVKTEIQNVHTKKYKFMAIVFLSLVLSLSLFLCFNILSFAVNWKI